MGKIVVVILIISLACSQLLAMPVPSKPVEDTSSGVQCWSGGRTYTDQEMIFLVVGIVCGTVILLAILN